MDSTVLPSVKFGVLYWIHWGENQIVLASSTATLLPSGPASSAYDGISPRRCAQIIWCPCRCLSSRPLERRRYCPYIFCGSRKRNNLYLVRKIHSVGLYPLLFTLNYLCAFFSDHYHRRLRLDSNQPREYTRICYS